MTAFLALMKREYLEHKGPFLYAPILIFGILILTVVVVFLTGSSRITGWLDMSRNLGSLANGVLTVGGESTEQVTTIFGTVFSIGFGGLAYLWWLFLLGALFFYCADAFNADRRNNAMLFWKSMPQSDFTILASKLATAVTLFPAMIFVAAMATGLLVFIALVLALQLQGSVFAILPGALGNYLQFVAATALFYALGLLWYLPFFAWVGLLSTIVGRWSIPLAFLIPALVVLLENLLLDDSGPEGGQVLNFLWHRADFGAGREEMLPLVIGPQGPIKFEAMQFIGLLLARVDWVQMAGGVLFALIALVVASAYRKRVLAG
ncbi:MAG: putative transporter, permease protein [Devosia sp.]|nr:putative transporter, permease protein [Devosia sp.]